MARALPGLHEAVDIIWLLGCNYLSPDLPFSEPQVFIPYFATLLH